MTPQVKAGIDLVSDYLTGHLLQHHFLKLILKELIKMVYDRGTVFFHFYLYRSLFIGSLNACQIRGWRSVK